MVLREIVQIKVKLISEGIRQAARQLKQFRFEMLGVMFFGMSMVQMFENMTRPAAEALGIFEMWTVTLQSLFLPVMQALLEPLMGFMNFFIDLPEPIKIIIGAFVVLIGIIGKALFIIGTLALGVQSLVLAFGGTGLAGIIVTVGKFLLTLIPIIRLLTIGIAIATILWKTNFLGFRDTVKSVFAGVKMFIENVVQFVSNIISGKWSAAFDNMKNIVKLAIDFMLGLFNPLLFVFEKIGEFLTTKIGGFVRGIAGGIGDFFGFGDKGGTNNTNRVVINNNQSINVSDKAEMERIINENNKKQVDEILRLTRTSNG